VNPLPSAPYPCLVTRTPCIITRPARLHGRPPTCLFACLPACLQSLGGAVQQLTQVVTNPQLQAAVQNQYPTVAGALSTAGDALGALENAGKRRGGAAGQRACA